MARRGQVGTIEVSGKWYVVRFWKYPKGQDRVHVSEKLCVTDPKSEGFLSRGERRRKANEIVEASGVNDEQQFVEHNLGVTFREQAKHFLNHSMTRKRNPVKTATLTTWESTIDKWLNPILGDLPLSGVGNATAKTLVAKFHEAGLSPKTISNYFGLVKLIVGSAIDREGEQMFPRKWNHEFIDLPIVEKQHQPVFSAETMSAIVSKADRQEQVLYSLLAGSGLRVGEAFGLEIKHLSADCRTIKIEQSMWAGKLQTPKTKNAFREVDLAPELAKLLKSFVGDRKSGLIFTNQAGRPLSQTNLVRRSLHSILEQLEVEKSGFHGMRRFRATWLRKQRAPEDLIRFWMGHAKTSITDDYSKLAQDVAFRLETAEKVGTGFAVPTALIPMVPRKTKTLALKKAA